MTQKEFLDSAIPLLEKIQATPELQAWCEHYSVYKPERGQPKLSRALSQMMQDAYAAGIVITDYQDVIHVSGMGEDAFYRPDPAWVETLGPKQTLAAIAYQFRRDHFCEGSLINQAVASGALLCLFRHLRSLGNGASGQSGQ